MGKFLDEGAAPSASTMTKMVKTSYEEINKLSSEEAAYTAGLIDGDGSISLTRHSSRGHSKDIYRRLEVSISNTDIELLKQVKDLVGPGCINTKQPDKKRHSLSYVYKVTNRQAFNFLTQITPYLRTYKQKRAKLVLKKYIKLTPRNGKYSRELIAQKKKFIKDFFAITGSKESQADLEI